MRLFWHEHLTTVVRLRARPRCKADTLPVRELDVALRVGRAPATVRNHLQAIYAKLEVSDMAELVAVLRQAEW